MSDSTSEDMKAVGEITGGEIAGNSGNSVSISNEVWDAAIGKWISACVRSSPLAHDVGAWNRLNEVLPKLREFLNNQLSNKE